MRSFCDINEIKGNIKNENCNQIIDNKDNKINEINNSKINNNANNNNQKEEIIFYTMQTCPKCKKENKINNISDIIHHRISQKRDNLSYKCEECGEENIDIII